MPQDIPGFYYDAEKNRYFPIKARIPGASPPSSSTSKGPVTKPIQETNLHKRSRGRTSKLLHVREIQGNVIVSRKGKCNFKEEIQKIQASQPVVWKYQGTDKIGDGALEQIHIDADTPQGQTETDILLSGGVNGMLSFLEVGKIGDRFDNGTKCIPECVWPPSGENRVGNSNPPGHIWRPVGASLQLPSNISCIKLSGKYSPCIVDGCSNIQHALITTLGSETAGGSVFVLNLLEPIDFTSNSIIRQRIHDVATFNCTIWTADCNKRNQAVIGTNLGAALVNLETGRASWICRSKSDVLAQQLDHSGNFVLCGLRNGAIVTIDVREKQGRSSARLSRHRIPYSPSSRAGHVSRKQWFELKGNICPAHTIYMPSSISSLVSLQCYDQYFLASSMDGSVKLYDNRLTGRGALQSYEGLVNSHTRTQLGVDPTERFVMSGGEDCSLRLWNIKSGEMLFEDNFCSSVLSNVCWRRAERYKGVQDDGQSCRESLLGQNHGWEAWLGSQEGVFHMHWL